MQIEKTTTKNNINQVVGESIDGGLSETVYGGDDGIPWS